MKKGDRYLIRNTSITGEPIVEGEAILVTRVLGFDVESDGREFWEVRFPGENNSYHRYVKPDDARNP